MLERVGRYKIVCPLGKGAMGIVYLAEDAVLNRQVAVKTIDLSIEDPQRREFLLGRLLRDARAAAALSHPNIVAIYDVVQEGESAGIIMEYVAGENLGSYLSRTPVPDSSFTMQVVRAMASALDYTHSRNVVHRDIKPANVMLDASNTPKITDFGIARITEGVTTTMTGAVMGTIEYMAPEQIKGEAVDGRADQFALGVVAYRMLSGHMLFGEHSMATLAYKIVNESPAPVRSRNSGLPLAVDPVVAKALAKDAKDRYRNCTEFADALAGALKSVDLESPTIAIEIPRVTKEKQKSKIPVLALGAISAAAVLAAGLAVWKPWASSPPPVTATQPPVAATAPSPAPSAAQTTPVETAAPATPPKVAEVKKSAEVVPEKKAAPDPPKQPATPAPVSAEESYERGRTLMEAKDYNGAVQAYDRAVELRPGWGEAYEGRANAYKSLTQCDAAVRDYTHAIQIRPKAAMLHLWRGQCYVALQQDDAALQDFNDALALKAEAPVVLNWRAALYMRRKDYKKAESDYSGVIRKQPESVTAYRGRAQARAEMGNRNGARKDEEKANELAAKHGGGKP
jgi:serine/threonine protein kinase/Tfp pilus assembly protein PilF